VAVSYCVSLVSRETLQVVAGLGAVRRASLPSQTVSSDQADLGAASYHCSTPTRWRNSLADSPGTVAVRDFKAPDGPRMAFRRDTWQAFAAKVKAG